MRDQTGLATGDMRNVTAYKVSHKLWTGNANIRTIDKAEEFDPVFHQLLMAEIADEGAKVHYFRRFLLTINSPYVLDPVEQYVAAEYGASKMAADATRMDGLLFLQGAGQNESLHVGRLLICAHCVLPSGDVCDYVFIEKMVRRRSALLGGMIQLAALAPRQYLLVPPSAIVSAAHVVHIERDTDDEPAAKRARTGLDPSVYVLNHYAEQHTFQLLEDEAIKGMLKK
ncbi:hypothetical protein BC828DRAFT_405862 [Blastocladiella britannica]|nr:hypothetical protein BC828DRAFT_405862 [Blastocladiella britannica]